MNMKERAIISRRATAKRRMQAKGEREARSRFLAKTFRELEPWRQAALRAIVEDARKSERDQKIVEEAVEKAVASHQRGVRNG